MVAININLNPDTLTVGENVEVRLRFTEDVPDVVDRRFEWTVDKDLPASVPPPDQDKKNPLLWTALWDTSGLSAGPHVLHLRYYAKQKDGMQCTITANGSVTLTAAPEDRTEELVKSVLNTAINVIEERRPSYLGAPLPVSLRRTNVVSSPDEILWMVIRKSTDRLSFPQYVDFIDTYLCRQGGSTDTAAVVGRERTVAAFSLR